MFVRTMQHKIWELLPTTVKLHSFLLACACAGKTFYLSESEQLIFDEAATDIRATRSSKKKRPSDATSFYTEEGQLIYWIHPRDAFLLKLVFLNDCYHSNCVGWPHSRSLVLIFATSFFSPFLRSNLRRNTLVMSSHISQAGLIPTMRKASAACFANKIPNASKSRTIVHGAMHAPTKKIGSRELEFPTKQFRVSHRNIHARVIL